MKFGKTILLFGFLCLLMSQIVNSRLSAQNIGIRFESVKVDTKAGLRGLDVVDDKVIWASGGNRTVVRTSDGGKSWAVTQLKVPEGLEFRDVEGFSADSALLLSAGSPGLVMSTSDGGRSWNQQYQNQNKAIFFDAFGFWDSKSGIAFSDPIGGKLQLISTKDGGLTWNDMTNMAPETLANEAGFAASGTCLTTFGNSSVWVGLGGKPSEGETKFARVFYSNDRGKTWNHSLSTLPRSESAGIFSLCFVSEKIGFATGGDYKQPEGNRDNLSLTFDGGKSWRSPKKSFPTGFRSCIAAAKSKYGDWILVATGTNGTDLSLDGGESWFRASNEGFHAIAFSPGKMSGWASGASGKMARFKIVSQKTR